MIRALHELPDKLEGATTHSPIETDRAYLLKGVAMALPGGSVTDPKPTGTETVPKTPAAGTETDPGTSTHPGTETDPKPGDVTAMEEALKKANKEAEKYRLKLKGYEDEQEKQRLAGLSENERLKSEADAAKTRAEKAETDLIRFKVGATLGLPVKLAERLRGSTEEEMLADGKELLATIQPTEPTTPVKPTGPIIKPTNPAGGQQPETLAQKKARLHMTADRTVWEETQNQAAGGGVFFITQDE